MLGFVWLGVMASNVLMPNPVYTYVLNICYLETHFVDNILNETYLNGSKYLYVSLSIQFNISHFFAYRVDLGTMAIKGYSAFPKDPVLQEPYH